MTGQRAKRQRVRLPIDCALISCILVVLPITDMAGTTQNLRNLDPTRAGLPNLWANHVSRRRVQRMGDLRENGKRRTYLNLRSAKKDGYTEGGPP